MDDADLQLFRGWRGKEPSETDEPVSSCETAFLLHSPTASINVLVEAPKPLSRQPAELRMSASAVWLTKGDFLSMPFGAALMPPHTASSQSYETMGEFIAKVSVAIPLHRMKMPIHRSSFPAGAPLFPKASLWVTLIGALFSPAMIELVYDFSIWRLLTSGRFKVTAHLALHVVRLNHTL